MNPKRKPYNKAATTAKPDCGTTAEPKPTPPPPEVQDEIERAIRAGELPMQTTLAKWCFRNGKDCGIIFGDTTFALANPKLSGEYFRLTDERGNCFWEKCYWADPASEKLGDTTPPDLEKSRELEEKTTALDSQINALGTMPLCQFYNITETAHPATAQAADGDEIARQLKVIADNTKPRKDKGKPHKRTKDGWRLQTEMVADFSLCAFKHAGRTYGAMSVEKVKDWETRYPDANHRERKSGYYSEMRRNPDLKREYLNAAAQWNDYWRTFHNDFKSWLRDNPKGTIDLFKVTWTPPGKTVAMNSTDKTLRYGADMWFADSPDGNDI